MQSILCKGVENCFELVKNSYNDWYILSPIIIFFVLILLILFLNGLSKGYSRKRLIATKGYLRAFLLVLFLGIAFFILLFIFPVIYLLFNIT